jgi:hypothetical protein
MSCLAAVNVACRSCLIGWCGGSCGALVSKALAAYALVPFLFVGVGGVSTQYLISIRCTLCL